MNKDIPHISVITPVYGCSNCLTELYKRLEKTLSKITPNFEIIMVNDCSPDNSWQQILAIAKADSRVKGINFSRNFGQHYAITAGIDYANGDWIVVMDCDLQEAPEDIALLYNEAIKGFDVVLGKRALRKDGLIKKMGSYFFNKLFNFLSEIKRNPQVAFFVIFTRNVCENLKGMREHSRFMPSLLDWSGFSKSYIDITHNPNTKGSGYNFNKLISLAFDAIISHSNKPLRLIIQYGFFISAISILLIFYYLYLYLFNGVSISGWTSLIISIWFLSGNILSFLGIIAIYIGKSFNELKNRPLYIIKEKTFNV